MAKRHRRTRADEQALAPKPSAETTKASIGRRSFLKLGVTLLPYVVPAITTFTPSQASANKKKMETSPMMMMMMMDISPMMMMGHGFGFDDD
jgi:hypothetical protein